MRKTRIALVVLLAAVVMGAVPAAARSIVDFARNAGHVDGLSAVPAHSTHLANRLIATDGKGHLPNGLVKEARDAKRLGGAPAEAFVTTCGGGSVLGAARVPQAVSTDFQAVTGYSLSVRG